MPKLGYVKLHRSLLEWEWYHDLNTRVLFLHLLLTVNFEDKNWHGITVKRGQRVCSYRTLSKETGLSVKCVRTALEHLKATGEVAHSAHPQYGLITISNYEKYQERADNGHTTGHTNGQAAGTPGAQFGHTKRHTTGQGGGHTVGRGKNRINTVVCRDAAQAEGTPAGSQPGTPPVENPATTKEERNKEENILSASADAQRVFEAAWALYPNKRGKGRVSKAAKGRLAKVGLPQLERCVERYLAELAKEPWRHPQNGSTFFNSGYVDYLDENYGGKPDDPGDAPFLN